MVSQRDFRPRKVAVLLVGEAAPADGPHFYQAAGNLFSATQAAFAAALGDGVPSGDSFLRSFAAKGWWQVNLNDCDLARVIAETKPRQVVVIKAGLAPAVARAIQESAVRKPPSVTVLRYPIRQWRAEFVTKLAEIVTGAGQ